MWELIEIGTQLVGTAVVLRFLWRWVSQFRVEPKR